MTDYSGEELAAGRVTLRHMVGGGGMGVVYEGWDNKRDRKVAVKILNAELARDPEVVERFEREGKKCRKLRHTNLVKVRGFGRERRDSGPLLYIVSEFVEGETLARLLRRETTLEPREALRVAREIAHGVSEAHREKIVHRDLKPENVMLLEDSGVVKVLDFGIAKTLSDSTFTNTGIFIGTPGYAAPEQIRGEDIDERADVFALGTILYEMLAGRVAFDGARTTLILEDTELGNPIRRTDFKGVNKPIIKLLADMIQKSRRKRTGSMPEVIERIEEIEASGDPAEGDRDGLADLLRRMFGLEKPRGMEGV